MAARPDPQVALGCPNCYVPLSIVANEDELDAAPRKAEKAPKALAEALQGKGFQSSTKLEALVAELKKMEEGQKALVFSQFTTMLDLVAWRLRVEGIQSSRLDGSVSLTGRRNILAAFRTDPALRVLLLSLRAGGEGLNLQCASHVFLLEPWWNPAVESQAIQRAHRIGQKTAVRAVRFVMEGTLEENMLALQKKKQAAFDATVGREGSAMEKLTEDDIRFLFGFQ
jgi:DNA repair protein RAD16